MKVCGKCKHWRNKDKIDESLSDNCLWCDIWNAYQWEGNTCDKFVELVH